MTRHIVRWAGFLLSIMVLSLARIPASPSATLAQAATQFSEPAPTFTQAELFFELNHTDEDLGIHAAIDGGPWTHLDIEGPGDVRLLDIVSQEKLRTQGLTQLAFESAEPSFDELSPAAFFRRFPAGVYEISGLAQNGQEFETTVRLSHVMPAPAGNVTVSGVPAPDQCEEPTDGPIVPTPVIIDWDPVTASHPTVGASGPFKIALYQLFVEAGLLKLSLDLPPTLTRFEVPAAVTSRAKAFKFEIIARATNNNNTAVESCYQVP